MGTPWSNKSDAQPPEEDNPRNLLFSSRILQLKLRFGKVLTQDTNLLEGKNLANYLGLTELFNELKIRPSLKMIG